jgi:acetylglutamate kinase
LSKTIVVKVGGSTWESRDATLDDIVALQREGQRLVVVHGGGDMLSRWLDVHGVESRFVDGLRFTGEDALPVAVAVLAGLVNKQLVAGINAIGGKAVGLSGADGACISARRRPELGFVGEVERVDAALPALLLDRGYMPVIAPIGVESGGTQLLNINADSVAGEIAVALKADVLAFLTDVPGVLDVDGRTLERLSAADIESLVRAGTISRGMLPKVEACVKAAAAGCAALIIDGRQQGALRSALQGQVAGTQVG